MTKIGDIVSFYPSFNKGETRYNGHGYIMVASKELSKEILES